MNQDIEGIKIKVLPFLKQAGVTRGAVFVKF